MSDVLAVKAALRLLNFMADHSTVQFCDFGDDDRQKIILTSRSNAKLISTKSVLNTLVQAELIDRSEKALMLTELGRKRLARMKSVTAGRQDIAFSAQHRQTEMRKMRVDGEVHDVEVNLNESPLARLKARKMVSGDPWLSDVAFAAGERLRSDFTRSQLMQKTTSSWDPSAGGNKSKGGAGGKAEITDTAVDARSRLERALDTLGPELAGLITDVCCFLKGLESVERERCWPPRSAKLMLRVGLDLLARHYGTSSGPLQSLSRKGRIRKWGGEGYRPAIL